MPEATSVTRIFTRTWSLRHTLRAVSLCLFAVLLLGAGQADDSVRYDRLGHAMICTCGCGQILLECNHVSCPDSPKLISDLKNQLGATGAAGGGSVSGGGGSDREILKWFVAKYGATVLAAPMQEGFGLVAWIVPLAVFALATLGTALLVRMWTQRTQGMPAGAGGVGFAPAFPLDDSVRDRIRRDTEYR